MGVKLEAYYHGDAPEADGIKEWPCRYCKSPQKHGAGYICDKCAAFDRHHWVQVMEV